VTFRPPSGLTATELVDEKHLENYVFENDQHQYVQGGAINLVPIPDTGLPADSVQYGWPNIAWDQYDDFVNPPGLTNWGYTGESRPGEPYWLPEGTWLNLYAPFPTDNSYVRQAADETGTFWSDTADNSTGYVVEMHVRIAGAETGTFIVDDGTRRQEVHFFPYEMQVVGHPDLTLPGDFGADRAFRFIGKGDDFHIVLDDGMGVAGVGKFTTASTTKELVFGMLGSNAGVGLMMVDKINQYHGGAPVDVVDPGPPVYSTSFVGTTLPVFAPGRVLTQWETGYFDISGTNDGTTRVVVEYRSSGTPNWTQSGGTTTLSTTPRHEVDLTSVPVVGDGSDEIRFKVEQSSTDGSGPPYGVSQVMVTATGEGTVLTLYPTWGPEYGSTAAIDIPLANTGVIQFPVQSNWPAEASTELLYHFDELSGNVIDASGNSYDGTIPGGASDDTLQAQNGWFGYGIHVVDGNGQVDVPVAANLDYNQDVTISFFCKAHTRTSAGKIWEHKSGSRGVEIRINTSGQLEVFVTNGSGSDTTHTHTGAIIGGDSWVMVWVKLLTTTDKIRTRVTGSDWEETATSAQDYYTDLTLTGADMFVGCWGTFDEFQWYAGDRSETTWDSLSARNVRRSVFTSPTVVVDGEDVTGERVNYYHPNRIYVRMPPHAPGEVPVWVDETGVKHYVPDGYRYVRSYSMDVSDELEAAQACTTKSPFRVGFTVADGDVNLALLQGPELSVTSHMSRVGLEHLEADNIAAYRHGQFALTQPDTGTDNYVYTGAVDTDDLLISVKSVMRRGFKIGRPLFYKYLVGRGQRYVYHRDASTVADIELVRNAIRVQDELGNRVRPEDYPWEIDISLYDFHGDLLPANTFSVVLYTEIPGRQRKTYSVVYNAVDARSNWERKDGFKEVINPVPMFERNSKLDADFQYDASLEDTGYYSLTVTS
jgi:hypothetical protein